MPIIVGLIGGKFRRKKKRKAREVTLFMLMWSIGRRKVKEHLWELKALMQSTRDIPISVKVRVLFVDKHIAT